MEIFEHQIKDHVSGLDANLFLAIDVDSGDFEVSNDDLQIFDDLRARRPNALILLRRIGDEAAYFMGAGGTEWLPSTVS